MIVALLKGFIKNMLHAATDEWMAEIGVERAAIEASRSRRLALAAEAAAEADAAVAKKLRADDDDGMLAALPMPSAARVTDSDTCPPASNNDDAALMAWMERQRQAHIGWADIANLATEAGYSLNEEALRSRYRRWHQ